MVHITSAHRFLLFLTGAIVMLVGCSTDPLTHRSRPMLVTQSKEAEVGTKAFHQFLNDPKIIVIKDTPVQERVSQVFARLVTAAKHSAYAEHAKTLEWEVVLVEDARRSNTFSFPGGKVGVYTGLLPFATTDGELAGALGHSVASILARHPGERISKSALNQLGQSFFGPGGSSLLGFSNQPAVDPALIKLHQEEADKVGILLAAEAGYDPDEAFRMWVKIFGPGPRLDTLREYLPETRTHYNTSRSEVPLLIDSK